ncbi:ABC transporter ATP-binding protein [Alkalicoccobacillus gibsonii]|uniref:ABC transporter ATP-binding protein n=1 Tax=Alkalicoccobacillus gibsonii TaxID=79881 RepID=UPI0019349F12|nr:betaine/proline/choline family ABC transporter ATP-binding protein [Alkalicoccobacillus gibsonii]MBM0064812.1 betaine/proline/choline family ABC transporter ATP-binding protein [Alkalicoccobacillus gibsonii]
MITFEGVTKTFADGTKGVNHLSLTINSGEFFVLIGPSGCGKTTTMKMINRLIDPTEGTIKIDDDRVQDVNIHKLRWNIGYVLQQIALFPNMTIAENIAVVPEMMKWSKQEIQTRVDELLQMVGLDPEQFRHRMPDELSGGQQQRIGVARALAGNPNIILMDEPFSALDPISREQLQQDIKNLQKDIQKTIVFVTHDMDEALALGEKICVMQDGTAVQIGTPEELITNPKNEFVQQFIGNRAPKNAESIEAFINTASPYLQPNHSNDVELQFILNQDGSLAETTYRKSNQLNVEVLSYKNSVKDVYASLQKSNLPALPVERENKIIGTISYEDLARMAAEGSGSK